MKTTPSLRQKLRTGQITYGSWIQLAHPAIAEIMAAAGFDWLTVDLEHSTIGIDQAEQLIRTIGLCGVAPLVRLSDNDPVQIKRVMDAGAEGVIVPMVKNRAEIAAAVAAVRYPPQGSRGVGLARAQGYGTQFEEYRAWVADDSVIIAQIEHIEAVHNLDEILSTPGVAGFIVGPYDLSGSLGLPGEFTHPEMLKAQAEIRRVAARHPEIAAGYHIVQPQPKLVAEKVGEGYRFIAYSTDMILLGEACRGGMSQIRPAPGSHRSPAPKSKQPRARRQ
ncbi:MAG: aldolase/citrate lyase family protein [Opitutaceae bacterium]|nr:aldolase/citrate lyase family protein [Opitutaceae bacterium]